MRSLSRASLVALIAFSSASPTAHAQDAALPSSRPLTMVVSIAPGGSMDALARIVAEKLKDQLQHNVVVENRTGAGSAIGTEYVARAAPDGHTILLMDTSIVLQNLFQKNVGYDAIKDFDPIAGIALVQLGLFSGPSLPAKDIKGLIEYGRANPTKLSAAFGGVGSPHHLAATMFNMGSKLDITLIPYRGSALSLTDLLAGQIPLMWSTPIVVMPNIRDGKLNGIGVASGTRIKALPDIPTFAESGFPEVRVDLHMGFAAPRGTPKPLIDRFSKALSIISEMPDVRGRLADLGFEVGYHNSSAFRDMILNDHVRYRKIVDEQGLASK